MSSSEDIRVRPGEMIPLRAQETDGITNKVILATIYRDKEMTDELAGPITLQHSRNGYYVDCTIPMPSGLARVYAQYLVFDSDGVTPNTDGDKVATDVFVAIKDGDQVLQAVGGPVGVAHQQSSLDSAIETADQLTGQIESGDQATGVVHDGDEAHATSSSDESLFGEIQENQKSVGHTGGC